MRQRKNRKIEGKITDTVQNIFVYDCCLMNQKKLSLPLYHEVFDTVKLARKGKKMHQPSMEQGCKLACLQYPSLVSPLLQPREGKEFVKLVFSVHFNRN